MTRIAIGSDHAGFELKSHVVALLRASGAAEPLALVVTPPVDAGVVAAWRTSTAADGGARLLSSHAVAPPPPGARQLSVRLRAAP